MRIAIVRGPYLNKPEMQSFEPLLDDPRFSLCAVATPSVRKGDDLRIPIVRLHSPESFASSLAKPFGDSVELALRGLGFSHYMFGMENILDSADVIHTVETVSAFSLQCARYAERSKKPLLVTHWENIPFNYEERVVVRRIRRVVRNATSLFLVPAMPSRAALVCEGVEEDRIQLIRPGVDLGHFSPREGDSPLRRQLNLPAETRIVLFAGRLEWEKGIFDLLDAFTTALERLTPKPFLLIVGDGTKRQAVEDVSRMPALREHCQVVRRVPYSEMPTFHRAADVAVVPSRRAQHWEEQFGMVVAEAMASGVAVIGSDSGAIPEVVGKAGVIFPAGNRAALAEAICSLLSDDAYRTSLGNAARQRALDVLDARRAARDLASVYARFSP